MLGFEVSQKTLYLLGKLAGRTFEGCCQFSDDICLVAAAVNQLPNSRRRACQNHRLGCVQVQQSNPPYGFSAYLCHKTAVSPDHDQNVIVRRAVKVWVVPSGSVTVMVMS